MPKRKGHMPPGCIKNPNAYGLKEILNDLPRHVWDSSAEPPKAETSKQFIERVKAMSNEERIGYSVSAGIHNPGGTLTEAYGGKSLLTRKGQKAGRRKAK